MSDFNNENNNDPIVFHAIKALRGDIIYDANGVPLFQIDDVQGSKVFDASNDGDKKPMVFQVGADPDQKISIGFDTVSPKALGIDKLKLETVAKPDFNQVISEIEKFVQNRYGYDKLSNKHPACLLEGWISDICTNLKKMDYISVLSLTGSASDNNRNDYNDFYQETLRKIVAISKNFLQEQEESQGRKLVDTYNDGDKKPMEFEVGAEADQEISIGFDSVENSGCKEYTKKVQDVFGKNLSKDDEKAAVEELIAANKNNLHICPPDFEEIIDSLENTDISTIGNVENAYELLMNAMHYTFSSRLINIQYLQDAEIYCYPIPTDTTTPNPEL